MSAVEKYLEANNEFEEAKRALSQIARTIQEFGTNLQQYPERTYFSNLGEGGELPVDIMMTRMSKSMDANSWPNPLQIQAAVRRRFAAKQAAQAAWETVPNNLRSSLVPPRV